METTILPQQRERGRKRKGDSNEGENNLRSLFQAFKRAKFDRSLPPSPASASMSPPSASASGFLKDQLCCSVCRAMKPASAFYPSHVSRSVFRCKECMRVKAAMQPAAAAVDASSVITPGEEKAASAIDVKRTRTRKPMDAASHMLDRLRRLCSRPDNGGLLPERLIVGFDAKIARKLLVLWHHRSALNILEDVQGANEKLRFLPWYKQDQSPLMPWEVVPLTQSQARRLASIPIALWEQCLDPVRFRIIQETLQSLRTELTAPELPDEA